MAKQIKYQFGDRIQITKLSDRNLKNNIEDSEDLDIIENRFEVGDIALVVYDSGSYVYIINDPITVESVDEDYCFDIDTVGDELMISINKDQVMLYSEESELAALNELTRISQIPVVIKKRTYDTLDEEIKFENDHINVGCQTISKEDALKIAEDIQARYGVKK
jgi:hypothetical protein